ncbi:MAG: BioD-like phosphotransacetylase family protein [Saprospiraceae bacterium]|jgi:BioD-like phosphotransacetylase family protein
MKYKNLYIAASSQHVGKTTSTLGITSTFIQKGLNVGYCKPVGQKFLKFQDHSVDKDTLLFADLIKFDIKPEYHSPIVLPSKLVRSYIREPKPTDFEERILAARDRLNEIHDLTIFEGTGHPGVGSVVGLSNAKVAKMLDAGVIMILEGGIGSTIDMFHMCTALFREQDVPIVGVIINKVRPDKLEMVEEYIRIYLERQGIPLLGMMPYDEVLAYPLMRSVAKSLKATVTMNEDKLDNRVENMLAGSLVDLTELKTVENHLLIASNRTIDRAIKKVESFSSFKSVHDSPLCGIIVTGEGDIDDMSRKYIEEHELPLLRTNFDTYGAVLKISRIEVKINRSTPWKINRAIEMINANVNLDRILASLKLQ